MVNHPNRSTMQKTYYAIARPAGKPYVEIYHSKSLDAVLGAVEYYAKKNEGGPITIETHVDGHPGCYQVISTIHGLAQV